MDADRFDETTLDDAESRFQAALLANDVAALDGFLHDDVRFTGPDGSTIDKAEDMAAHRAGALVLATVAELKREVQVIDGVGITRALLHLVGTAGDDKIDLTLAYTRTWVPSPAGWVVAAAHGSPAPPAHN
ncbi:nuclear transport factor 2 family protein [Nonomuraea sp. K274]|uniref:Nuclear transport factor 2 family protein n=1 Tax=Nonomuraea cypriaca TaxID=1187855 RepID=A0A931A9Z7_9ACTN|nr:nuclear transport factor 2 family protein [Nonomuraea cypriaca]MBF8186209.1 nuclear transport factor 2 family protein [Nonomuraea cypriaca]